MIVLDRGAYRSQATFDLAVAALSRDMPSTAMLTKNDNENIMEVKQ